MSPSASPSTSGRSGDPLFPLVAGLYVAVLATAPVVYAVTQLGVTDSGALYGTVLVTMTAVTGVGWLVTDRRPGLAVRLGATQWRWLPAAAPVPYALGGFASLSRTGVVGVLAFFLGLAAMVAGFAVGVMARTRHADAVVDGVETACSVRAGWPAAAQRRLGVAVGLFTLGTGACFILGLFADWLALQLAGQLLLPLGVVAYSSTEKRDYAVTAAGLEQRLPIARRLVPWDSYGGYSRTDDALVLHRPKWFDTRFALDDLEDPDAVEAAVAEYIQPT